MGYSDQALRSGAFWAEQARRIHWFRAPQTTLGKTASGSYNWFADGELNSCYLALDHQRNNFV